jgi:hypothetical protein
MNPSSLIKDNSGLQGQQNFNKYTSTNIIEDGGSPNTG